VSETLAKLGLVAPEKDVADYTSLLTGIWEIWNKVDQMEDYVPVVDEERFPRKDVHFPGTEENPANAWAWKASVKDMDAKGGLLEGKTVCLKVRPEVGRQSKRGSVSDEDRTTSLSRAFPAFSAPRSSPTGRPTPTQLWSRASSRREVKSRAKLYARTYHSGVSPAPLQPVSHLFIHPSS
jgi:hypothetical protein